MKFSAAFRQTLLHFDLKAADLAEKTGLTPVQISQFRNEGRNIRIDRLERILQALPIETRSYLLDLMKVDDPTVLEDMKSTDSNET